MALQGFLRDFLRNDAAAGFTSGGPLLRFALFEAPLAFARSLSLSLSTPPSLPPSLSLSLFLSLSLSPSSLSFSLRFRMFGQLRWSEKPRQVRRGKQQIEAIGFHSVNLGPRVTFVKLRMAFSFSSARSTMPSPMAGRIRCCSKMPCISMKEKHKEICLNLRH